MIGPDPFGRIVKVSWSPGGVVVVRFQADSGAATDHADHMPVAGTIFGNVPEQFTDQDWRTHMYGENPDFSDPDYVPPNPIIWGPWRNYDSSVEKSYFIINLKGRMTNSEGRTEIIIDMSSCFPVGAGYIIASMKLFGVPNGPPEDATPPSTLAGIMDAIDARPTNTAATSTASANRWYQLRFRKDGSDIEWLE